MQFVLDGQEKEDQRQAALTEQFAALHASGTRASFTVGQPLLAALPPGGPVAPVTFHGVVRVAGRHRSKVRREDLPGGRVETFVVEHINVHHLRPIVEGGLPLARAARQGDVDGVKAALEVLQRKAARVVAQRAENLKSKEIRADLLRTGNAAKDTGDAPSRSSGIATTDVGAKEEVPAATAPAATAVNAHGASKPASKATSKSARKAARRAAAVTAAEAAASLLFVDSDQNSHWSALHWACYNGHAAVVVSLVQAGANPSAKADGTCGDGRLPLHVASGRGHVEVVRTLLLGQQQEEQQQQQQKQKQKQQSSSGNNGPSKDRQDLLPSLSSLPRQKNLGRGSSSSSSKQIVVDATDDFGETALHKASEAGHIAVVKLLLAHGSDPRCTNARNQTPLQLAVENGHERARLQLINWRPPLFWQQTRHPSKVEFI